MSGLHMPRLRLSRQLANALMENLLKGAGSGWLGARAGQPCSVYPGRTERWPEVAAQMQERGERLFATYGAMNTPAGPGILHFDLAENERGVLSLGLRDPASGDIWEIVLVQSD